MARYTPIHSDIWFDDTFKQLSDQDRLFFVYALTSPHCNMLGYYRLPIPYICVDMGWRETKVRESITKCCDAGRISYDDATQNMLVANYLKWNPIRGIKQIEGAVKQLGLLPLSRLHRVFLGAFERHLPQEYPIFSAKYPIDTLSVGYPSGTVSGTVSGTGTVSKDKREKRAFAPSVHMTDEQYANLTERFGESDTKDRIERLSLYKQSKGRQYKCDYSTILNWARKEETPGSRAAAEGAKKYE